MRGGGGGRQPPDLIFKTKYRKQKLKKIKHFKVVNSLNLTTFFIYRPTMGFVAFRKKESYLGPPSAHVQF